MQRPLQRVPYNADAELMLSSVIVGAFTPGIVPLVVGRVHELVQDHAAQRRVWEHATTTFAVAQAMPAYGFSYLFGRVGSYAFLFSLGVLALATTLVLDGAVAGASRPARRGGVTRARSAVCRGAVLAANRSRAISMKRLSAVEMKASRRRTRTVSTRASSGGSA